MNIVSRSTAGQRKYKVLSLYKYLYDMSTLDKFARLEYIQVGTGKSFL